MNAIVPFSAPPMSFTEVKELAKEIATSGLWGIKTPAQAVSLMMISQAEGRHPALAAQDYDIINGRPAKRAEAMLRHFLEAGGSVQWHALSDEMADATFTHPRGGTARINWNMERAAKAGLRQKDNYGKYPRQMLRSRTVSEGVRTIWPSATSGLYSQEEVRAMTIEGHAEPAPEAPTQASTDQGETRREQLNREVPLKTEPKRKQTVASWLEDLEREVAAAPDADLQALLSREDVRAAAGKLRNGANERYNAIVQKALDRIAAADDGWGNADAADAPAA